MPDDLHLPYAQYISPATPKYISYDAGRMPCRHQWMPPSGQWGGGGMNSLVYGLKIGTDDMKVAIPYILGYATSNGAAFERVLPIADPDGFGMTATGISIRGYYGASGLVKLEIPSGTGYDGAAPDGHVYNDTATEFFDLSLGLGDGKQKVADLYNYVLLSVTFEHAQYWRANDNVIAGDDLGERDRFTIWNFVPGIEYVGLDSNVIYWCETDGGTPPLNTTVGKGAGFVRATGELKCDWYGVPGDALIILLQKWLGFGPFAGVPPSFFTPNYPVCGRTNFEPFTVDLTNIDGLVTFPAQTLLFQPPRITIVPNPMGYRAYNIGISLTYRPEKWTSFLHWPSGRYFKAGYSNKPLDNPPPPFDLHNFRPVYGLADFERAFEAI